MFPGGRCRVKPRRWTPSVPRGTSRPPAGYDRIHRSRVRGANATVRAIPVAQHGDRPSSSRIASAGQVPATRDGLDRRGLKGRGPARTQPGGAPAPLSRRAVSCGGSPAGRPRDLISGERTGAPRSAAAARHRDARTMSAAFHVEHGSGVRAPHRTPVFHVEHPDDGQPGALPSRGVHGQTSPHPPHDPRGRYPAEQVSWHRAGAGWRACHPRR
jgi:hypothetical protein